MQLFYSKNILPNSSEFIFSKEESRHIVRVLRKKEGDTLHLTNGIGNIFTAKIITANDKKCIVKIIDVQVKKKEHDYYLHIAIAPTKNINRFEWFLEKATEIGIDEITPIISKNSERKTIKNERLEKIIQAAMKQSLKFSLPKLNNQISFSEFIATDFEGQLFIAHCEETNKKLLKNVSKPKTKITILIGPEGDFTVNEIQTALNNSFKPVSLGNSRLRTETAGVVVATTISLINQ